MATFAETLRDETIERMTRKGLEEAISRAADRGLDANAGAIEALASFLDKKQSPVVKKLASLAGFGLPAFGAFVAGLMKEPDAFKKLLPDDTRPAVKEIKFVLSSIIPSMVIGSSEAIGDQIKKMVDAKVSPKTGASEALKCKPLDRLVWTQRIPKRVFICKLHEDGRLMIGDDGLPVIDDAEWINASEAWESAIAASGISAKNRDPSTRFPHKFIGIGAAADILFENGGPTVDADKILELKKTPDKSKEGYAAFSDATVNVLIALAGTISGLSEMDYDEAEDLVKDQFKGIDPAKVNLLAKFEGAIQPGEVTHFTQAKYRQIMTFIDTVMGGERNWYNVARRHFRSFLHKHNGAGDTFFEKMKWVLKWIWTYARWVLLAALLPLLFFLFCGGIAAYGTFMIDSTSHLKEVTEEARFQDLLISIRCLVFGTWGMLISLTFLKLFDVVLRPIGKWVGFAPDVCTDIGRRISAFVGVYGFLMVLIKLWSSGSGMMFLLHYLLLAGAAGSYGFMMMAVSAGWIGQTKLWVLQGATAVKKLVVGSLIMSLGGSFILGLINYGFGTAGIAQAWGSMWDYFHENRLFASIVILAVYVVVAGFGVRLTEGLRRTTQNGTTFVREPSGLFSLALFLIGVALVCLPWFPSKQWVQEEEAKTTQADVRPASVVLPPMVAPASSARSRTPEPRTMTQDKRSEPACSEMAPALRKYVARCQGM